MKLSVLILSACAMVAMPTIGNAEVFEGHPRVLDGDTLRFGKTSIRLDAIDAPESKQTCSTVDGGEWNCGKAATRKLKELVAGGVICESNKMDLYRRYIATCINSEGVNINQALVAEGYAWAFRRYSTEYAGVENKAREQGINIWQAETLAPWDYRKNNK